MKLVLIYQLYVAAFWKPKWRCSTTIAGFINNREWFSRPDFFEGFMDSVHYRESIVFYLVISAVSDLIKNFPPAGV